MASRLLPVVALALALALLPGCTEEPIDPRWRAAVGPKGSGTKPLAVFFDHNDRAGDARKSALKKALEAFRKRRGSAPSLVDLDDLGDATRQEVFDLYDVHTVGVVLLLDGAGNPRGWIDWEARTPQAMEALLEAGFPPPGAATQ